MANRCDSFGDGGVYDSTYLLPFYFSLPPRAAESCALARSGNTLHMVYRVSNPAPTIGIIDFTFYHVSRTLPNGAWSAPEMMMPWETWGGLFSSGNSGMGGFGMDLTADAAGRLHFAYIAVPTLGFGDSQTEVRYLTNESGTWSAPANISGSDFAYLSDGAQPDVRPSLAFDGSGDLHASYVDTTPDYSQQMVREVVRSGSTWSAPATISNPVHNACRFASIAAQGTNLYLAYADNSAGVWCAEDTGSGWGTYTALNGGLDSTWSQTMLEVGAAGERFVFYQADVGGGQYEVRWVENTGGGWSAPAIASDPAISGAWGLHPYFAVDAANNIYFIYDSNVTLIPGVPLGQGVFFRRYDRATTTWSPGADLSGEFRNFSGGLVFDGANTHVAFAHTLPTLARIMGGPGAFGSPSSADVCYRNDLGGSWSVTQAVSNPSGLPDYDASGMGAGASSGILADKFDGLGQDVFTARVGGTWSAPAVISPGTGLYQSAMATDTGGHQHVLYSVEPSTGDPAMAARYTNNVSGAWSAPVDLPLGPSEAAGVGWDIKVAGDGTVHFCYSGLDFNTMQFSLRHVTCLNGVWSPPETLSTPAELPVYGKLALDTAGNVHLLYMDAMGGGGGGSALVKYITNSSGSWSAPVVAFGAFVFSSYNIAGGGPGEAHIVNGAIDLGKWQMGMFYMKTDGAGGFTDPILIGRSDGASYFGTPQVAVDAAGSVHVMYAARMYKPGGCDNVLRYTRKDADWSVPVTVSGDLDQVSQVQMGLVGCQPQYAVTNAGSAYFGQPTPIITSISPSSGPVGTTVTVKGLSFGHARDVSRVTVNGVPAPVLSWSDTKIIIKVPNQATTGPVVVQTAGAASNDDKIFTVLQATWYLAEGCTAWGFDTYITIENPNDSAVNAKLTYMNPSASAHGNGIVGTRVVALPPLSQTTVYPRTDIGDKDFSTRVDCLEGKEIAVDRTMTWTGGGAPCGEAHSSVGVTGPARTWFLPEGSCGWGFETWTLVQNPNAAPAQVTLTYMVEGQGPRAFVKTVPAYSRATYNMSADLGAEADASIEVSSPSPVVAERAMYRNSRREGSCSVGTTTPGTDYYLAEGTTAWGFSTYVLVCNPNPAPVDVTLTYMTGTGPKVQPSFTMPADSRKTVKVNDALPDTDCSIQRCTAPRPSSPSVRCTGAPAPRWARRAMRL